MENTERIHIQVIAYSICSQGLRWQQQQKGGFDFNYDTRK